MMRALTSITVTTVRAKPKRKKAPAAKPRVPRGGNDYPLEGFGGGRLMDRGKKRP